jgi:hypothetical protein
MDGRFFSGKKIKSYFWDGSTDYSIVNNSSNNSNIVSYGDSDKEDENRLEEFGDWLDNDQEELPEEFRLRAE